MSRKKTKDKSETIQATLNEVVEESKTKKSAKVKSTEKKPKKPDRKSASAKKPKRESKKGSEKKVAPKKKTVSKKKTTEPKPKKEVPVELPESAFSLTDLPGVGPKLQEKLIKAKYETVEKISRARPPSLAKKVEGLSQAGAKKLTDAAKDLVKRSASATVATESSGTQPVTPEEEEEEEEVNAPKLALTDVPGLGSKLALSMERAGYDSVARLARASPENVAKKVGGLSVARAASIVNSAKDLVREQELAELTLEPTPIPKPTTSTEAITMPEKEEPVIETKPRKKPTKEKPPKKIVPDRKVPPVKKPAKTPKAPPKKKPKPVRKDSGMNVPVAIKKLANEMKENWTAAEKRVQASKEPGESIEPMIETVEVINLTADDTTERIIDTAIDILNETMLTGRPAFDIPSRSGDNIVWDEVRDLLLLGMRTVSRPYHSLASVVDATRTARVMEIVFNLLKLNLHATKREVYYSDVNLFREQKYSDKIIEDVASMIQTTRDSIHVVASARGSAMGRVTIRDGGDLIDLTKMGTGGWAVTPFLDQLEIVESDAEFIILSEKDAAVMRLAEAKYWNRQPCIVITGKGSGDIATRAFLKMLVKELEIPAFALVDSDPYGHYIYSVFLRGSKRLSYESPFIATPELKLLGVLSRDLDEYKIPKAVRIPMQPTDIKRVKDMLKEPFVKRNKPWVEDLELMLKLKEKAEIQAFASHSFEYLTDEYLPRKLETGDWI
ncbi:MAG: helix-hairpin-helix domain-containing protein [Candidatus Thorarchaeota archaeon]